MAVLWNRDQVARLTYSYRDLGYKIIRVSGVKKNQNIKGKVADEKVDSKGQK